MELSTTAGGDYVPDAPNCSHCSLDTTGTHHADCPLYELQRLQRAKEMETTIRVSPTVVIPWWRW